MLTSAIVDFVEERPCIYFLKGEQNPCRVEVVAR